MKLCGYDVGLDRPFFLIAGPCVVESRSLQMDVAGELKAICADLDIPFIFKSSYDKANRSSHQSFRGLGLEEGLRVLGERRLHEAHEQRMAASRVRRELRMVLASEEPRVVG